MFACQKLFGVSSTIRRRWYSLEPKSSSRTQKGHAHEVITANSHPFSDPPSFARDFQREAVHEAVRILSGMMTQIHMSAEQSSSVTSARLTSHVNRTSSLTTIDYIIRDKTSIHSPPSINTKCAPTLQSVSTKTSQHTPHSINTLSGADLEHTEKRLSNVNLTLPPLPT
eukprot:4855583-Pyramimonas_sp.AAC.1